MVHRTGHVLVAGNAIVTGHRSEAGSVVFAPEDSGVSGIAPADSKDRLLAIDRHDLGVPMGLRTHRRTSNRPPPTPFNDLSLAPGERVK
jgi:hypothetical protein